MRIVHVYIRQMSLLGCLPGAYDYSWHSNRQAVIVIDLRVKIIRCSLNYGGGPVVLMEMLVDDQSADLETTPKSAVRQVRYYTIALAEMYL